MKINATELNDAFARLNTGKNDYKVGNCCSFHEGNAANVDSFFRVMCIQD